MSSDEHGAWVWPTRITLLVGGLILGIFAALLLAFVNAILPLPLAGIAILALPSAIKQVRHKPNRLRNWVLSSGLVGFVVGAAFWAWVMNQVAAAM